MQLPGRDTLKRLLTSGGMPSAKRASALVVGATTSVTVVAAMVWNHFVPGIPFPITPEAVGKFLLELLHVFESAHFVAKLLAVAFLVVFTLLREPTSNKTTTMPDAPTRRLKREKARPRQRRRRSRPRR